MSRLVPPTKIASTELPRKKVLVLVGPTASGKTAISLRVAEMMPLEIISADSRQVYKLMNIGTAKPTAEQQRSVPHHFVNEFLPEEEFSAGEFGRQGRVVIDEIVQRGKLPFVVGGSGLYLQALIDGFFDGPSKDPEIRRFLEHRIENEGAAILLDELRRVDPQAASAMLPTNVHRIIRALEVYTITGIPLSQLHQSQVEINFDPIIVGLRWDRKKLYDRINRRVEEMLSLGLIEEVTHLKELGYKRDQNALLTTGYVEVFQFLDGEISHDEMVRLIKQNSRRYAKRQLTWFRPDTRIHWFDVSSESDFLPVAEAIVKYFHNQVHRHA